MHELHRPAAHCVSRARNLVTRAALEVQQLENGPGPAFCQLTALLGMWARLEVLAQSYAPDIEEVLLDTATVCREAEILLCSIRRGGSGLMRGPEDWGDGRMSTTSVQNHASC